MDPLIAFGLSLALLVFAGRHLAAAGRALGLPDAFVSLLESVALG